MLVYLLTLALSLLITKATYSPKKNNILICAFISGLPFALISGVRYYVGTDYGIYKDIFNIVNLGAIGYIAEIEKGFLLLNRVVGTFTTNYQVLLLISSLITITAYFFSIFLLSEKKEQSIIIWFLSLSFFESMNTVRQSLAVALCCFGIYLIYKKKLLWYIVVILCAISFHRSAIIFLPLYWISNVKFGKKFQIILVIIALIGGKGLNLIVHYLPLPERYLTYLINSDRYIDFRLMDFVISCFIWIVAWLFRENVEKNKQYKYDLLLNFEFYAVLVAAFSSAVPMANRIILYFIYTPAFLLPSIYIAIKKKRNRILINGAIILMYISQYLYYVIVVGIKDMIIYRSIFT